MRPAAAVLVAICALGAAPDALAARGCEPSPDCRTRCLDGVEKLPVSPWGLSLETGLGIGFFFETHASLRIGIGRRFWDRLELEAIFQLVASDRLLGLGGVGKAGVLLHLSRRWELLLGWRVGYVRFDVGMPVGSLWTGVVMVSTFVEAKLFLTGRHELRIAPFAATGYWNQLWGFVAEPTVGYAWRF